jgi:PHD/YefM family antitoxin component YafN of YafNO toxin-antitoxin module
MLTALPSLADLPRQNASHVKNKWGDVVRHVHQVGTVAITNHANVEMVLIDAATYQQLSQEINALNTREQSALDDLTQRFNDRLAVLQAPQAPQRLDALLAAKGKLRTKPKAGASF